MLLRAASVGGKLDLVPSFIIYQSEHGVRTENTQLKAELSQVRQEANALRRELGREEVAYAALSRSGPAPGEQFAAGNCRVSISAPNAGYHTPTMASPEMQIQEARRAPEVQIMGRQAQVAARVASASAAQPVPAVIDLEVLEAEATGRAVAVPVAAPQAAQSIQTTGKEGQRVTITMAPPPAMNPAIAAARAQRAPQRAQAPAAPAQVAQTPQPSPYVNQPEVDTDEARVRFSLLEL